MRILVEHKRVEWENRGKRERACTTQWEFLVPLLGIVRVCVRVRVSQPDRLCACEPASMVSV